jgi:drug/metabolite transporter (DMT)-like permease
MTPLAMALVGLAAVLHAFWNLLSKRTNPSAAFFLIACLAGAVLLAPFVMVHASVLALIPAPVWAMVIATGVFEAWYYSALAGAYRHGDMSVAYPLARALPVLLITAVTVLLGIGKPISAAGFLGILAVAAGCLIVPLHSLRDVKLSSYLNAWCLLAAAAAIGTTGYTLVDSQALATLRDIPETGLNTVGVTVFYLGLATASTIFFLVIYTAVSRPERHRLIAMTRADMAWAALAGLFITCGYSMVLVAMAFTSNVSYIAAFRQLSLPLGAILGIVVGREPAYPTKIAGIIVVLAGLVIVSLA